MVLTDRQREDLHAGIYEYLVSRGEAFEEAAKAFAIADPKAAEKKTNNVGITPLMEKKWTAIPRLQKKVLELERTVAQSAKIHAHRTGDENGGSNGVSRRMLPRLPCSYTLAGHSAPVTCVKIHPIYTVVVSGSEDGTIKVSEWISSKLLTAMINLRKFPFSQTSCQSCRRINQHIF
jgi:platelet-activating factor acetylhydrolase IB subunit alpha